MQQRLKYSDFWDRINVEAFEEAIDWTPETEHNDNDMGFCPFPDNHANGDTTGKFAIHREKRVYNCFVCGGGSLLSLAMELFDYDVEEATEWLYQFCEDDRRSDSEFVDEFLASFEDVRKRVETLPFFNERVLDQFNDPISDAHEWDDEKEDWTPFLEKRGISYGTVDAYQIRYKDEARRPAPGKGKFADEEDYYGPAVIFPHYYMHRLVGWQSRWLDPDRPEWVPKYTMTTDFPKDTTIYGYDLAREPGPDGPDPRPVLVVESVPSALFAESCGYPTVATFGSNVNEAQLRLLRSFSNGVILGPDNDVPKNPDATPAGIKWRDSLTEYLKRYIRVWHLPPVEGKPGADIGDLASLGDDAFDDHINQAKEYGVDL